MTRRVVVVGAGVSGLTAAYRLTADPSLDVVVLEAAERAGGSIGSVAVAGVRVPAGADSFLARRPGGAELCDELGLELIEPAAHGTWLWTPHGLVAYPRDTAFGIPGDPGQVLRWPGLSRRGRLRALADLVKKTRKDGSDETLGSLLRRRLGDEATDRALAPLLAGLHAGDADALSVQATFPELPRWERAQGSLIRGAQAALRQQRGLRNPAPMFARPRGGMEALTGALAARLGERVRAGARVEALAPADPGWEVRTSSDQHLAAAVVLAIGAEHAADLLAHVAPASAAELGGIPSVSVATVCLVYPEGTADRLPEGTGFVVPRGAAPMTGATCVSSMWPDPAFGSRAVIRCTVGGGGNDDVVDAPDADIVEACERHLASLLPLPSAAEAHAVVRWPRAMPQYGLGHLHRVERLRASLPRGVFVTGASYDGVGVSDCIRAAGEQAAAVLAHLDPDQETRP